MPHKAPDKIRNVALIGHRGSGKTSLCEALLFEAGVINRLGRTTDGSTMTDFEPDEHEREMSIDADRGVLRLPRPQDQPDRHARRPVVRRRHARRPARGGRRGRCRERRDGRGGPHRPPLAACEQGGAGPPRLREHARPRARRLLPHARLAQGGLRPARRRHRDPDRRRARDAWRRRPDRHEGLHLRRRGPRGRGRGGDPGGARRAGRGVPREADGRGRRELRRVDGALPRGRGDLPRGARDDAQEGRDRGPPVPGHLRYRDQEPRHQPAARGDHRGPALARHARRRQGARRRGRGDRARARSRWRARRLRLQDHRRPLHRPDQPAARLLGRPELGLAGDERHALGEGAHRPARGAAGQGARDRRRARRRRHRRRRQAARDPRRATSSPTPRGRSSASRRSTCRRR